MKLGLSLATAAAAVAASQSTSLIMMQTRKVDTFKSQKSTIVKSTTTTTTTTRSINLDSNIRMGRRTICAVPLWITATTLLFTSYSAYALNNRQNVSLLLNQNSSVLESYADPKNDTFESASNVMHQQTAPGEDVIDYNVVAPRFEDHLERSSIIYGLVKVANESNVNPSCHRHLKSIRRGILRKEPWAIKALDASGTKPSGFLFGHNYWFGSKEGCGAVQKPVGITLSANHPRIMKQGIINDIAPFSMDYRVVYLRHNSPWQVEIKLMSEQIIHVGLCLPSSCDTPEIQHLMAHYIREGLFIENDIYDIQPELVYMKDLKIAPDFFERESFKLLSVFVAFILAMALMASYLRSRSQTETESQTKSLNNMDSPTTPTAHGLDEEDLLSLWNFPKVRNFIMCFDVQENLSKMFSVRDTKPTEIPIINGLRSVCAVWILVFHVLWFMYFTVHNKAFLISYAEKTFFQYISSAALLVDVFFTISGFLQTYNFFRNAKKVETIRNNTFYQNAKQFLKMTFHRYLRLVPLYLVVMAAVDLLFAYIGKVSVYDIHDKFDENCANYWWRNIFFIQNLFEHRDMCVNWTWSLACEMQYFLLATALLFIYTKYPRFVKAVTMAFLGGNILWSYGIGMSTKFQLSFDTMFATGTDIYISPFVRILPYIIGAIAGWAFVEYRLRPADLSEMQEKSCWHLSISIFFVCMYSTIKRDISTIMAITLFVVGRILFSMAISWMIIGSATGRRTMWSRFLEAKPFQHFNRISYAMYLLNPFVIALFFSFTNSSTDADPLMLCVLCTGFTVIVYAISVAFSVAFEVPFCNWSTQLLKGSSSNTSTSNNNTVTTADISSSNSPDLCEDLNRPYSISLAHSQPIIFSVSSPFELHFIVAYMNYTSPYTIDLKLPFESLIHLGLCLPKSCNSSRIHDYVDEYFGRHAFETQEQFGLEMRAVEVKIPHFSWLRYFTKTAVIIFLIILIMSISLPILAEIVTKSKHRLQLQHSLCRKSVKLGVEVRSYQQQRQQCAAAATDSIQRQTESSMWEQMLMCFLISDNFATVTSLDNSNRNSVFLTSMAGLRSIICMWITVFHVYYYSLFAMSNTPFIFAKLERFALQPIMQACFYVDVFFIMRLTPVMVITLLLSTMVFDVVNMYTPFRLGDHSGLYCKTIDVIYSTLNQLYVKPWVRIPPYFGGAIMGWVMHWLQKTNPHHSEPEQVASELHDRPSNRFRTIATQVFWLLTFIIYIATNFMSYWRSTPSWAVASIMSVGKLIFALFIGGIIIQCSRGHGGILNRLLSSRPFLFLNKFCFSIYMLAPIIVVFMFALRNEPTSFTEIGSGADFFAVIVLAILSAMLLYLLVELPMQRISNVLLK
ncbi:uncharacterized protein LOC133337009 [Musca vetustissima]|uniref:uncharacterized protein LOC133337009 n=1 Tax=Musca vetustissima TaxID=27455 RepID=UPI002AB7EF8F|nr:uncharacterized protein LOC133337009 [Musca vetustissima]